MTVRFFDRQDESNPLNGCVLERDSEIMDTLESLRSRPRFFAELVGENQYNLLIGLGGADGSVQYSRTDGVPPYLMAVGPNGGPSGEYLEFLIANTPTPVSRRYALPFDLVKEIAVHFARTGERSSAVSWEEI